MKKYEIRVNIELARIFTVEAESQREAEYVALDKAEASLEPPFSVDYSDELYHLEVEK